MEFKIGQTSPLDMPIHLLMWMFPSVGKYYKIKIGTDAYQHVYSGFIFCLMFCALAIFTKWMLLGCAAWFMVHVIIKEVIMDKAKRITDHEKNVVFKVDMITRIAGFVMAGPFIAITLIWG